MSSAIDELSAHVDLYWGAAARPSLVSAPYQTEPAGRSRSSAANGQKMLESR